MTSEATYATFETSGGAKIHRLPLQAFPKFWAYAYVVQKDDDTYLIDTGSGTDASNEDLMNGLEKTDLQPSDLTHILLTHAHIGHYTGLMYLGREVMGANSVPVYAMPRMEAFLRTNGPWSQLVYLHNIQLLELRQDSTIALSNALKVTPEMVGTCIGSTLFEVLRFCMMTTV